MYSYNVRVESHKMTSLPSPCAAVRGVALFRRFCSSPSPSNADGPLLISYESFTMDYDVIFLKESVFLFAVVIVIVWFLLFFMIFSLCVSACLCVYVCQFENYGLCSCPVHSWIIVVWNGRAELATIIGEKQRGRDSRRLTRTSTAESNFIVVVVVWRGTWLYFACLLCVM